MPVTARHDKARSGAPLSSQHSARDNFFNAKTLVANCNNETLMKVRNYMNSDIETPVPVSARIQL